MAFCGCNFCDELGSDSLSLIGKLLGNSCVASSSGGSSEIEGLDHRKTGGSRGKNFSTKSREDHGMRFCNIVSNPRFANGTKGWIGMGCCLSVGSYHGTRYCIAKGRSDKQHGPAQEIGKRLDTSVEYHVEAWVRIAGHLAEEASVVATIKLEKYGSQRTEYQLGSVIVKQGRWSVLTGTVILNEQPLSACICFHGPDGGVDLHISRVAVIPNSVFNNNGSLKDKRSPPSPSGDQQLPEDPKYGQNIVSDTNLGKGLGSWYPMGNCTLEICSGGPKEMGSCGRKSFVYSDAPSLSGNYIYTSNRTETYEGPAQDITSEVQLFNSYQVTGWVAVTRPGREPFNEEFVVNVALDVDGEWMTGGEVSVGSDWKEIKGSFRLETQPKEVIVYFQGPDAGVDMMVGGLYIFAVDRLARTPMLQDSTNKIRKRDIVVKFLDQHGNQLHPGTKVALEMQRNSFPIGSSIQHDILFEGVYRRFFQSHFNWAVFESEFKWDQIEPEEDEVDLREVNDMIAFCNDNEVSMRGHCLLWEDEEFVQDWVKELDGDELLDAVEEHIRRLINRYHGEFKHYDVNNEILHGSFYEEKLGGRALPYFFKLAHKCDPKALLFLNDYHILDGYDADSAPREYVALAEFMLEEGAPVGGLGVQGHLTVPVGPIIERGLDLLSVLNLPIWFTELDVSSINEHVRADDLEVTLREAFAHPAVDGCLLWGFWEDAMYREDAHLVNSDGTINAAGRRFLDLMKEWTTSYEGVVNKLGEVSFRGFLGKYNISIDGKRLNESIVVEKGDHEVKFHVYV